MGNKMEFQRFEYCKKASDGIVKYSDKQGRNAQIMGSEAIEHGTHFTVDIISCGPDGSVAIGVAASDYPTDHYPGWDTNSIGYHTDDGGLFYNGSQEASNQEYVCTPGDKLGCSVKKTNSTYTIDFLRNGKKVYSKVLSPSMSERRLYPLICMDTAGDAIKIYCEKQGTLESTALGKHHYQRVEYCRLTEHGTIRYDDALGRNAQLMGSKMVKDGTFFTVEIIKVGAKGAIAIGIAPAEYPKEQFPGWATNSIGFHTDDGALFCDGIEGTRNKQYICKTGDTLGCSIKNTTSTYFVSFLKNGKNVYTKAISSLMSQITLYPLISMDTSGDTIKVNLSSMFNDDAVELEDDSLDEQFGASCQIGAEDNQIVSEQQLQSVSSGQELGGMQLVSSPKEYRLPSPAAEGSCSYIAICTRFKAALKISDVYMDSRYDLCYCDTCETTRDDRLYYKRGIPPQLYATPTGWCRFGLKIPPKAEEMEVFKLWHVGYHGTSADNLIKILRSGDLLMPGDHTLDGNVLKPPSGHFDEGRKPSGFDIQQVFISPTVRYAGMNVYAKQQRWKDPSTGKNYTAKVALQLRIKPLSYQVGKETVLPRGLDVRIDPKFKNSEIEWSTKRRGATIVTGLLLSVEES